MKAPKKEKASLVAASASVPMSIDTMRKKLAPTSRATTKHNHHEQARCYCRHEQQMRDGFARHATRAAMFCHKQGHFLHVRISKTCSLKEKLSSVKLVAVASRREGYVDVTDNGCKATFKIDSGAEVTVVPATFSGIPYKLDETEGQLTGSGNQSLPVTACHRTNQPVTACSGNVRGNAFMEEQVVKLLKNNVKPVTFSDHCLVPLEFRDSRHEKSRFNWGLRKLNLTLSEDDKPQDLITMYFKKINEQGVATFERWKSFEGNVKFIAINRSSELLY